MRPYTLEFLKERVEALTLGTVTYKETIQVPEAWWREYQRPRHPPCALGTSILHVFDVKRTDKEAEQSEIRWMGTEGLGFAWTYERNGRWYYTTVFDHPWRADAAENAVRTRARQGRPWT